MPYLLKQINRNIYAVIVVGVLLSTCLCASIALFDFQTAMSFAHLGIIMFTVFVGLLANWSYLHPGYIFSGTWLGILLLSKSNLSYYSRSPNDATVLLILGVIASFIFGSSLGQRKVCICAEIEKFNYRLAWMRIKMLLMANVGLAILNVAVSGYVPLVNGFSGAGNSDYMDFGIKGVYGLYNAFSNALAVFAFSMYLMSKQKRFLLGTMVPVGFFTLFLTRQNVISLLFECVICYSFIRRPLGGKLIMSFVVAILLLFSVAGEFRSGDIKAIAKIRPEYSWIPSAVIWPYSYSYFNVLNLDRAVVSSIPAAMNGSMFYTLLPSFMRPYVDSRGGVVGLEVGSFTVSSYITPAFQDIGTPGTLLFTCLMGYVTGLYYRNALRRSRVNQICSYSALLFCACFSFFTNFWTYLPIISQVVFFPLICWWANAKFRQIRLKE